MVASTLHYVARYLLGRNHILPISPLLNSLRSSTQTYYPFKTYYICGKFDLLFFYPFSRAGPGRQNPGQLDQSEPEQATSHQENEGNGPDIQR